jgi:hypothetical protein
LAARNDGLPLMGRLTMRSRHWLSLALAAFALAGPAVSAVSAEELTTPPAPQATSSTSRPTRGMTMGSVEAKFGAPTRRVPAVGGASTAQPPIARWEYPGFVVYFENDRVVHTVAIG